MTSHLHGRKQRDISGSAKLVLAMRTGIPGGEPPGHDDEKGTSAFRYDECSFHGPSLDDGRSYRWNVSRVTSRETRSDGVGGDRILPGVGM